MPECLSCVDVGKVNLNKRDAGGAEGIPNRNAGVGEGSRIDDDKGYITLFCRVYLINQLMLGIALEAGERVACGLRGTFEALVNGGQRIVAIVTWFPLTKQV